MSEQTQGDRQAQTEQSDSRPRGLAPRRYAVEFEKVDVWEVEVVAPNKRAAAEMVRRGEFDVDEQLFAFHGGNGRVLRVERCSS